MINLIHPYKTLPFLLAVCLSIAGFDTATAQTPGSPSAPAQTPATDSLIAAFDRYPDRWLQEKLFVHVDKTFYLAGEIVWLKVYDVDARYNTPLSVSGIAYIELLDKDQKAVLQEKIALNNGDGDGSFRLPSTIVSGHYLFRAYTSWMKNLAPDFYFHQELTILNTLHDEPIVDSPQQSTSPSSPQQSASPDCDGYTIRFFPEGGNLVNGLASVIAFKATGRSGNGIPCTGVIIDQKRDTITRFTSNPLGVGHFTLNPGHGNTYTAIVTSPAGFAAGSLPSAYDDGLVMHLEDSDPRRLRITVRSATMPADPTLYLFVHTHHRVRAVQANRLVDNGTEFLVDKDSLDDGISHITLFTAARIPVCERLYCKQPGKRLGIDVTILPSVGPRTKLDVDLATTGPSGHPVPADLSLSAFLIDSLQPVPTENILSYLLLRSDLRGDIESPQSYFADSDPATIASLDDLMLTQGWTRFRWEDILHEKAPVFEFLPESSGPVIHAKLLDKATGLPAPPQIGYLTVPGRDFKLSTAMSHQDGTLLFHVDPFYGNREIIIQTNAPADSNYRIDVSNAFSDRFAVPTTTTPFAVPTTPTPTDVPITYKPSTFPITPPPAGSPISAAWKNQLLDRSIAVQAENVYRVGDKYRISPALAKDTTSFYGTADRRYNLDDYTRFLTMDEVIREFVENVKVRQQSGRTIFRVRNILFNLFFEDDPLLLDE